MAGQPLVCVEDFEGYASRTLSKGIYDFVRGGAGNEETLRDNRAAFERFASNRI